MEYDPLLQRALDYDPSLKQFPFLQESNTQIFNPHSQSAHPATLEFDPVIWDQSVGGNSFPTHALRAPPFPYEGSEPLPIYRPDQLESIQLPPHHVSQTPSCRSSGGFPVPTVLAGLCERPTTAQDLRKVQQNSVGTLTPDPPKPQEEPPKPSSTSSPQRSNPSPTTKPNDPDCATPDANNPNKFVIGEVLPTGEYMRPCQVAHRIQNPDFPNIMTSLPVGILSEDIIKHWPNHLWGSILLKVAASYNAREIAALSTVNLKANAIVKRITEAKKEQGVGTTPGEAPSKRRGGKRKRASVADVEEDGEGHEERTRASPKRAVKKRRRAATETEKRSEEDEPESEPESEASRNFRTEQMELYEEELRAKDSDYAIASARRLAREAAKKNRAKG